MAKQSIRINKELLNRFHPLSSVDAHYQDQLLQGALIEPFEANEFILKKSTDSEFLYFLLEGSVEIRFSFENRLLINAGEEQAQFALQDTQNNEGAVRATEDCQILAVHKDALEQALAWSQQYNYEILHCHDLEHSLESAIIDDNFEEDWSTQFIQSPLASNLSSSQLHRLFQEIEAVEVKKGDVIVHHQSEADFFYIIQSGVCEVLTDANGAFRGQVFELTAGAYFGDEALVADTLRNASVVMASDGRLARLSRDAFLSIVKSALVKSRSVAQLDADGGLAAQYIIDVRFPFEIMPNESKAAEIIPICELRKQLDSFDPTRVYCVTSDGGLRSELATYLLRQAGLEAYCLSA